MQAHPCGSAVSDCLPSWQGSPLRQEPSLQQRRCAGRCVIVGVTRFATQYDQLFVEVLLLASAEEALTKRASYSELEAIDCDLSAFPNAQFFRVEVGERMIYSVARAAMQHACTSQHPATCCPSRP